MMRKDGEQDYKPVSFRKALPEEDHENMLRFLYMIDKIRPKSVRRFIHAIHKEARV